MAKKKNDPVTLPRIPLSDLSERYLHSMEMAGKSRGTVFSYSMELGVAQKELGADTPISEITRADIVRFNECPRVTLLRSGKPKSQLSIDKTRRVLRLALGFAVQTGLLLSSPAEQPVHSEPSEPEPAKKRRAKKQEPEAVPATEAPSEPELELQAERAPRASRKRRGAATLEVSQAEAEAAADAVESKLTGSEATPA